MIKNLRNSLTILLSLVALSTSTHSEAKGRNADITIETSGGIVQGSIQEQARVFLGVPYGSQERFAAPQPVEPWDGVLNATIPQAPCAQATQDGSGSVASYNEDCLYVDVYAPKNKSRRKLPVMVWLPGGGFEFGSTMLTNGTQLTQQDVIVVVVSYRVGALGFLANANLTDANGNTAAQGNLGLRDQQLALQWVQQNISAFGGNKNNVTLFGHSAGASSACLHQVSPSSSGLFDKLITLSGSCQNRLGSLAVSQAQGNAFAKALNCDTASDLGSCLRSKSIDEIVAARPEPTIPPMGPPIFAWGPTIDGDFIPEQPLTMFADGNFTKVPVIFGTVKNEGEFFTFIRGLGNLTAEQYVGTVSQMFPPPLNQKVLERYPLDQYSTPMAAFSAIFSDQNFHCPMREQGRLMATNGVRSYRYFFTENNPQAFLSQFGVVHGAEQPYLFGSNVPPFRFTEESQWLSRVMQNYFTNFAHYSNPNGAWLRWWPTFNNWSGETYLRLSQPVWYGQKLRNSQCDFWAQATAAR